MRVIGWLLLLIAIAPAYVCLDSLFSTGPTKDPSTGLLFLVIAAVPFAIGGACLRAANRKVAKASAPRQDRAGAVRSAPIALWSISSIVVVLVLIVVGANHATTNAALKQEDVVGIWNGTVASETGTLDQVSIRLQSDGDGGVIVTRDNASYGPFRCKWRIDGSTLLFEPGQSQPVMLVRNGDSFVSQDGRTSIKRISTFDFVGTHQDAPSGSVADPSSNETSIDPATESAEIGKAALVIIEDLRRKYGYPVDPTCEPNCTDITPKPGTKTVPRVSYSDPKAEDVTKLSTDEAKVKVSIYSVMWDGTEGYRTNYYVHLQREGSRWRPDKYSLWENFPEAASD